MAIIKGRDPRSRAERRGDEEVLARFEAGEFLALTPERVAAAVQHVEQAYVSRRGGAASHHRCAGLIHDEVYERFHTPIDCLETVNE